MLHGTSKRAFLTRELHVWDPLGGRHSLSFLTYLEIIKDPRFQLFCALTLVLFFATDPSGNRAYVPLWVSGAIWPVSYLLYMSFFSIVLLCQSAITGWNPSFRMPTVAIGFLALIPSVYLAEGVILRIMSNGAFPVNLQGNFIFYFLSVQVIEAVFFRFVFPVLRTSHDASTKTAAPSRSQADDTQQVIIGGERIPLRSIKVIEAREHHVEVTMFDGQTRLRARLGDIVAQTTPKDGIQTHRSWWVARHAAKGLGQEAGKPVLHLIGDHPVPVARTRVNQVQAWAEEHL